MTWSFISASYNTENPTLHVHAGPLGLKKPEGTMQSTPVALERARLAILHTPGGFRAQ